MSRDKENVSSLSNREKELTALGAAIASNCIPCIEYHIPQARKVGLSDSEIREALELADKVRRVPSNKVLQTGFALVDGQNPAQMKGELGACGCGDAAEDCG